MLVLSFEPAYGRIGINCVLKRTNNDKNKNVKLNNLDFNTLSYVLSRVIAEIFEKHGKKEGKSMDKDFEQFYALLQIIRPVIRVRLATEGK